MHTVYTPYVHLQAIAPNLTTVVGELVGARLIAHAGSLMNLAKQPASTVQILGAEKARPPAPTTAQPACQRPREAAPTPRRPTPPHTSRTPRAMTKYMLKSSLRFTLTRHLLWFLEPAPTSSRPLPACTARVPLSSSRLLPFRE